MRAARALRAGEPDRDGRRRCRPRRGVARAPAAPSGVWANDPVPLYPYPSSPDYRRLWGEPDARAWERAHEWYLTSSIISATSRTSGRHPFELEAGCCQWMTSFGSSCPPHHGCRGRRMDLFAGSCARARPQRHRDRHGRAGTAARRRSARCSACVPGLELVETGLPLDWTAETPEEVLRGRRQAGHLARQQHAPRAAPYPGTGCGAVLRCAGDRGSPLLPRHLVAGGETFR
jgi:hypothetical protein